MSKRQHLPLPALILFLATGLAILGWFSGARSNDAPVLAEPALAAPASQVRIDPIARHRDPRGVRVAGVVFHTGPPDVAAMYANGGVSVELTPSGKGR